MARQDGRLDTVGFCAAGEKEEKDLVLAALDRAVERGDVLEHEDVGTAIYRDPSGARLIVNANRRGSEPCVTVGFESDHRARWRPLGVVSDRDCRFCDLVYAELLDDEGEMIAPFALAVETMGAERALIPYGEPGEVRFAGLWESGTVWPDEAAYEETQEPEWAVRLPEIPGLELEPSIRGFAWRSLIPSGTFAFRGPITPHVLAYGIVVSTEERHNELGGGAFEVVRLDTLGGVLDACLPAGTFGGEAFHCGAVVRANLWLVGRPLTLREQPGPVPVVAEQPGAEQPGRLRRLFGRRRG